MCVKKLTNTLNVRGLKIKGRGDNFQKLRNLNIFNLWGKFGETEKKQSLHLIYDSILLNECVSVCVRVCERMVICVWKCVWVHY